MSSIVHSLLSKLFGFRLSEASMISPFDVAFVVVGMIAVAPSDASLSSASRTFPESQTWVLSCPTVPLTVFGSLKNIA